MDTDLTKNDLMNLDKQTLVTMLMMAASSNQSLQKTVDQLNKSVGLLTEEVALLRQNRFGRKSEKNLAPSDGQYVMIFNETEVTIDLYREDAGSPDPDSGRTETEEITYKRKKRTGKRREDLSRIREREVVPHELSEEELLETFPDGKWTRLPDEVYERVEMIPAKLKVDLLRNSIATPAFVAAIANGKFVNAVPVNRLSQEIERIDGVKILPQNMCHWVNLCSERYISRLWDRLHRETSHCHVMQADETPCLVNRDGRPAGSKSYMWVYRSGEYEDHPFILYDYQKTRKADHPREFLDGFQGICVTDGYQVYHTIDGERDDLTVAGCWAHYLRSIVIPETVLRIA